MEYKKVNKAPEIKVTRLEPDYSDRRTLETLTEAVTGENIWWLTRRIYKNKKLYDFLTGDSDELEETT